MVWKMAVLRSSRCTNFQLVTPKLRSLLSCRENDVQSHRQKEINNQNRERGVYDRFGGCPSDANSTFARGQAFVATDENNQERETKSFGQTHDDVAGARPTHHVVDVVRAVDSEQIDGNEIAGNDPEGDTFRHQQRHGEHHGEGSRHDQIINRINRERAQRVDLFRHFHRADLGRHGRANPSGHHQSGQDRGELAAERKMPGLQKPRQ